MSNIDIIRAWKDEEYRNSLTEEQRSHLLDNPAGVIELSDGEMEIIAGAKNNLYLCTIPLRCYRDEILNTEILNIEPMV